MSAQRLIDANALSERLLVLRCNITNVQCISDIFDICLTEVSNAPTVDKRPQGEWIRKCNEHRVNICCTNCGYDEGYSCFKYCPNCGSDMLKGGAEMRGNKNEVL